MVLLPAAVTLPACDTEPGEPDDDIEAADGETDGDTDAQEPADDEPADDSVGTAGGPSGGGGQPKPDAAVPCADGNPYGGFECKLDDGGGVGTNYCIVVDGE